MLSKEEIGCGQSTPLVPPSLFCSITSADFCAYFSLPVPGEPSLKAPKNVKAQLGETLKISCHFPCKFYSYEKYWCKWSNKGCRTLPSQDEGPSQAFVNCNQKSQVVSLNLNSITSEDEGWYWCGVKEGHKYGETVAVYVAVEKRVKGESPRAMPTCPGTPQKAA